VPRDAVTSRLRSWAAYGCVFLFLAIAQLAIGGGRIARAHALQEMSSEHALVEAIWSWQRGPVFTAVNTDSAVDLERFQQAVRFLERTTGIPYENGSDVGKIPAPELKLTLKKWDAWYEANRNRLRLNWDECRLLVASTEGKHTKP